MAMNAVLATVYLDVYDHDTTPTTIKTIALDNVTRIVQAYLQKEEGIYQPDLNATVELIALRPDKVGVIGTGSVVELVPAVVAEGSDETTEGESVEQSTSEETEAEETIIEPAIYGVQAELTQAMLCVEGEILFQFRLTDGEEVLRTEIFRSNNGRALDGETSEWADTYQGYNLDEIVQKIDAIGLGGITIEGNVLKITSISQAASDYHTYVDTKLAELRADLGRKVTTTNTRIDIITRGGAT